jgi:hypothetical protein
MSRSRNPHPVTHILPEPSHDCRFGLVRRHDQAIAYFKPRDLANTILLKFIATLPRRAVYCLNCTRLRPIISSVSYIPHIIKSTYLLSTRSPMAAAGEVPQRPPGDADSQFLCLTILGYRRPDLSEEQYRHHMTQVSAPMTKNLMVKYGVKRWTMVSSDKL